MDLNWRIFRYYKPNYSSVYDAEHINWNYKILNDLFNDILIKKLFNGFSLFSIQIFYWSFITNQNELFWKSLHDHCASKTEAAAGGGLWKKIFLKISQISEEIS